MRHNCTYCSLISVYSSDFPISVSLASSVSATWRKIISWQTSTAYQLTIQILTKFGSRTHHKWMCENLHNNVSIISGDSHLASWNDTQKHMQTLNIHILTSSTLQAQQTAVSKSSYILDPLSYNNAHMFLNTCLFFQGLPTWDHHSDYKFASVHPLCIQ